MAQGKLGSAALAATTDTTVYTAPADVLSTSAKVTFCNRTAGAINVRLSVGPGASPVDADFLEYDKSIAANSSYTFPATIVMAAGEIMIARASALGVSVRVQGYEDK